MTLQARLEAIVVQLNIEREKIGQPEVSAEDIMAANPASAADVEEMMQSFLGLRPDRHANDLGDAFEGHFGSPSPPPQADEKTE